jgi:hypothetical protein
MTKKAGESLVISIVMRMRRYKAESITRSPDHPMEQIWGFTQSHWMPPSVECLRAPGAAVVIDFE